MVKFSDLQKTSEHVFYPCIFIFRKAETAVISLSREH